MHDDRGLRDSEMITMLHEMASKIHKRDEVLSNELRQIADRLSELTRKASDRRYWCGTE